MRRSRIIELSNCFFTRSVAEGHELSNYRIFFTRRIAEGHGFLSRDLSFGPTDQREVIIELLLSITRRIAEGHEFSNSRIFFTRIVAEGHELSNYRIVSSHGMTRKVTNYRINTFNHTENRGRSRIFLHTECWECGGVGDEEVWVLVFVCDS